MQRIAFARWQSRWLEFVPCWTDSYDFGVSPCKSCFGQNSRRQAAGLGTSTKSIPRDRVWKDAYVCSCEALLGTSCVCLTFFYSIESILMTTRAVMHTSMTTRAVMHISMTTRAVMQTSLPVDLFLGGRVPAWVSWIKRTKWYSMAIVAGCVPL